MPNSPNGLPEKGKTAKQNGPEERPQRRFTLRQRLVIFLAKWVGYAVLAFLGRTLRWEVVGWEHWKGISAAGRRAIYTSWHRAILPATWFWRGRGIVVMSSFGFDAEVLGGILDRCGYRRARGSSSRGASRALIEMARRLQQGVEVGFTIDGPRGPRFVAKPGPVLLAKKTGHPIFCFYISPQRAYTFRKSWDLFQVPYPFARVVVLMAPPIYVPADADQAAMDEKRREMQETLDRIRGVGDGWWERKLARLANSTAGSTSSSTVENEATR